MRYRPRGRAQSGRRAAAVAELAVLLPFLCFAFVAALDFGRVFYYSIIVTSCARGGALYGSANTTQAVDTSGIQSAAQKDATNLDTTQLKINSSPGYDSKGNLITVTVTAKYPFSTITGYALPGVTGQLTLTRTVQMKVVPSTPNFN
jgi:Flp pilus assembly protein TadG